MCLYIYHFTSLLYYHSTTRYNFEHLKVTRKISPLEELVGGDLPPSSSQRLTGMQLCVVKHKKEVTMYMKHSYV